MPGLRAAAALVLAALFLSTPSAAARSVPPDSEWATVTGFASGCRVTMQGQSGLEYQVRYAGLDCPSPGHSLYDQASLANGAAVLGQRVRLERDGADVDSTGARLRHLYLAGHDTPQGADMVGSGWAWPDAAQPTRYADLYLQLRDVARSAGAGVWRSEERRVGKECRL